MNTHRLYIQIFFIFIIINLIFSFECDENSIRDDTPFTVKISESPIIVIGFSLNKNMDMNIRNLFNVTFLVECVLKGQPTQRIIRIVQAGSLLGRRSCQRLHVNREYIVFLEPFFEGTYRPVDFEEIPYNHNINFVLEKTCGLSRIFPFTEINDTDAGSTNKCPPAASISCASPTPKTPEPPTGEQQSKETTTKLDLTKINSAALFGSNPIDLEALSLLLAEHQRKNFSLPLLQGQNHKSLFSDDEARRNKAKRLSLNVILHMIYFIPFRFRHIFL